MIDLSSILKDRIVELYDGSPALASDFYQNKAKQVTVYTRGIATDKVAGVSTKPYRVLLEASDCTASVCVLNDNAVKVLVAMYPSAPKYVLVRLAPRLSWLLGVVGLFRRVLFGLVRVEGVATLQNKEGKKTYWLVLEQSGGAVHKIPVLPKAVGIPVFLKWLKDENIKYVVLRFYENLPELHREAGDLDILVSDEDKSKVEEFLVEHSDSAQDDVGDVRIGLHSVSGEKGLIPYYPPLLARQILERAIDGPAGSCVPEPVDALRALIYHALYHSKKGYASGIRSNLNEHTDAHPENDYAGIIADTARRLKVDVGETMEEMDEYMASVGWRPKLDTLAKIAETNVWVRDRFFSSTDSSPVGLAVFVLREWVLSSGQMEDVIKEIEKEGFIVIRRKEFSDEAKKLATDHLRGGTWGADEDGNKELWQPAAALLVVDPQCAKMPASYAAGFEHFRIRQLKEVLREKFDSERSSMHSTDNTLESWEYVEICFPDEVEVIKKEISNQTAPSHLTLLKYALRPAYVKHAIKQAVRDFVVRHFLTS